MTNLFSIGSVALVFAALAACSGNSVVNTQIPVPTSGPDTTTPPVASAVIAGCDISSAQMRSTMLAAINQSRASARSCGATRYAATTTLTWDSRLAEAAQAHSADMANNDFFSHTGSNGLSVAERAEQAGFVWRAIAENIATGQQSVSEVHSDWLQSPGHCSNIMGEQYTQVGASCVVQSGSQTASYWTVVFGADL